MAQATDDRLEQIARRAAESVIAQSQQQPSGARVSAYARTEAPREQSNSGIFAALQSGWAENALRQAQVLRMEAENAAARGDMQTAAAKGLQANALESRYLGRLPENYVRPEGGLAGIAHDIVSSLPFTAESMGLNLGGRAVGGAIGGALGSVVPGVGTALGALAGQHIGGGLAALYSGNKEARQNQASAYQQLIQQGYTPEEAQRQTFWRTYLPSIAVTSTADMLTGGLASSGRRLVGRTLTREALEQMAEDSLVRRAMETLPGRAVQAASARAAASPFLSRVAGGAVSEGIEEGVQTAAEQWGADQPLDASDILYASGIGAATGGLIGGATRFLPGNRARGTTNQTQAQQQAQTQQQTQQPAAQQEAQAEQQAQTEAQTQAPAPAISNEEITTMQNGLRSDLDTINGILAENTDPRVVAAATRRRNWLLKAEMSLNQAAGATTDTVRTAKISEVRTNLEAARDSFADYENLLAPSSQQQQPAPAQPATQQAAQPAQQPTVQTPEQRRLAQIDVLLDMRQEELNSEVAKPTKTQRVNGRTVKGRNNNKIRTVTQQIEKLKREQAQLLETVNQQQQNAPQPVVQQATQQPVVQQQTTQPQAQPVAQQSQTEATVQTPPVAQEPTAQPAVPLTDAQSQRVAEIDARLEELQAAYDAEQAKPAMRPQQGGGIIRSKAIVQEITEDKVRRQRLREIPEEMAALRRERDYITSQQNAQTEPAPTANPTEATSSDVLDSIGPVFGAADSTQTVARGGTPAQGRRGRGGRRGATQQQQQAPRRAERDPRTGNISAEEFRRERNRAARYEPAEIPLEVPEGATMDITRDLPLGTVMQRAGWNRAAVNNTLGTRIRELQDILRSGNPTDAELDAVSSLDNTIGALQQYGQLGIPQAQFETALSNLVSEMEGGGDRLYRADEAVRNIIQTLNAPETQTALRNIRTANTIAVSNPRAGTNIAPAPNDYRLMDQQRQEFASDIAAIENADLEAEARQRAEEMAEQAAVRTVNNMPYADAVEEVRARRVELEDALDRLEKKSAVMELTENERSMRVAIGSALERLTPNERGGSDIAGAIAELSKYTGDGGIDLNHLSAIASDFDDVTPALMWLGQMRNNNERRRAYDSLTRAQRMELFGARFFRENTRKADQLRYIRDKYLSIIEDNPEAANIEYQRPELPAPTQQEPAPRPERRGPVQEGTVEDPQRAALREGAREERARGAREQRDTEAADVQRQLEFNQDRRAAQEPTRDTDIPLTAANFAQNKAQFAAKVDAYLNELNGDNNILNGAAVNAEEVKRSLRTIRAALNQNNDAATLAAFRDSGLRIGDFIAGGDYSDINAVRQAESMSTNTRTTRKNPFVMNSERRMNEAGDVTSAEVRGTTEQGGEGSGTFGVTRGIDLTERSGYIDPSNILTPAAKTRVDNAQPTQRQRQQPDYRISRKTDSPLQKYVDNDFYDPAKRGEIIDILKKEAARAKKESKKTDRAGVKSQLLEFAKRADELRKRLESGDRDAISVASVGIDNSKFNFGFDTQERIDNGRTGLTVDDILAGKKASIDMNNPAEMFDISRGSLSRALGKSYRVTENTDGSFNVRTPSGTNINISVVDGITMSPELIEMAWGKEQADRVRRGDAAIAGSFDLNNGIPLIELSRGIATDFTANHEMFHAVSAMALQPEQMRTLQQKFGSEEAIADAYAAWRQGRAQETSTIRAIFRRISDFLSGIRSMFTGENFEDIFRGIESGRVWEQEVSQPSSFRETVSDGTGDPTVSQVMEEGQSRGEVDVSGEPSQFDTGTDGASGTENQAGVDTRRPSIVETPEQAKREGERVVSEGEKARNVVDRYLEPNGGTGMGQRLLDAVVPVLFNANRMIGRIFGWDVHDALERGLALAPGRAAYLIGHGDPEAGLKSITEIVQDIPKADRNAFETIAAYHNLRDIAADRRGLMDKRDGLRALAKDEKNNAATIIRDLRKNQAMFSGEEIRMYEEAAEGSRKLAAEYEKQAAELNKVIERKQTQQVSSWYDQKIKEAFAEHPEWEGKIQDLVKWGQYQLQQLVDMGVVSEEVAAKTRAAHPNYIPLMRNGGGTLNESLDATIERYRSGVLDIGEPLKHYTGDNERTLASPIEQLANMQFRIEAMKGKQRVMNMIADRIEAGEYGDLFRRLGNNEELRNGEAGINIYRNGQKVTYATDAGVKALVDAYGPEQMAKFEKILRIPAKILREGVTLSPTFAISNAIRDSFTAAIINPEVRPIIDTVRGLMSVLNRDANFDEFLRHGGDQQMTWGSREQRRQNIDKMFKPPSISDEPFSALRKTRDFLSSISETSELATRVGTYMRLRETGVSPNEASWRAVNMLWFSRGGTASKSGYARNIPFFNAALQGTYSLGRAFSKDGHFQWNPKAAMNGLLYFTIPSMLLTMWNLEDDERREKYLEIPEQQRNMYYNIVAGDTVLKIPKAHTAGMLFSSLTERFLDWLWANDRHAFDGLAGSLIDSLGPDMTPAFIRLPYELMMNKSLFYQRDIVPASEQRYEPVDQYGPYTSDTARWLARIVHRGTSPLLNLLGADDGVQLSPRKIEYAINQLTGNLGRDFLSAADAGIRWAEGRERPDRPWHQQIPLTRRFAGETSAGRRTENIFREELEAALAAVNSAAEHAKDTPRSQLSERDRRMLGAKNAIQNLQTKELRQISALSKEIREIAGDKRMDGTRKRRLMETREAKVRQISSQGLQKLERILNR